MMSDSVDHSQPTVCGVWIERHAVLVYAKRMLQSLASESPWYRAESGELDGRGQGSQSLELVHRAAHACRSESTPRCRSLACVLSCALSCVCFRVCFRVRSCVHFVFCSRLCPVLG